MDCNIDMSSLYISSKKRRLSGLLKLTPQANEANCTDEDTVTDSSNSNSSEQLANCMPSSSQDASDQRSESTQDMGKTAQVEVRRSTRRKSVINIDTQAASVASCVQELNVEHDLKELKKIYLDKRVKKATPSLETIFETPTDDKLMSIKKFRRMISFQEMQRNKVKKRPLKAKQSIANYNKLKRKNRVSMETLMKKLDNLEGD